MRLWYFHFNKWIWELGDLWLYLGALLEKAIILRIQDILVAWILPQMDDILGFHCNRYRWMCSYFYMSLIVVLFWEIHNDRHYGRVVKARDSNGIKSSAISWALPALVQILLVSYYFLKLFFNNHHVSTRFFYNYTNTHISKSLKRSWTNMATCYESHTVTYQLV